MTGMLIVLAEDVADDLRADPYHPEGVDRDPARLAADDAGAEARLGARQLAGEEVLALAGQALDRQGEAVGNGAAAAADDDVAALPVARAGRRADRLADPVPLDLHRLLGGERGLGRERESGGRAGSGEKCGDRDRQGGLRHRSLSQVARQAVGGKRLKYGPTRAGRGGSTRRRGSPIAAACFSWRMIDKMV